MPPDNATTLANALIRAGDDRAALAEMWRRARDLAVERFDRAKLAAQWVNWVADGIKPLPEVKESA